MVSPNAASAARPLIRIRNLKQYFPVSKGRFVKANDGIDLDIYEGETFGLVGESGCGKSTLGRVLLQLYHQTDGRTLYYGRSTDDVAPEYIRATVKNLRKLKHTLAEREQSRDRLSAERDGLEGCELFAKMEAYAAAARLAEQSYLDIVQIIGGLIVADDPTEIIDAYLELHDASRAYVRQTSALREAQMKLVSDRSEKNERVCEKLLDGIEAQKKELAGRHAKIDTIRKKYENHKDFAKHDAFRDDGIDLSRLEYSEMRQLRRDLQLIFQDPYSSLNPRMTVGQIIGEGLRTHGFFEANDERQQDYIMKVMEDCGLSSYMIHRYPHQFSGGQRQRIGIARSLAVNPKFVVCDEAVSALDVSIQSQIINLLQELKEREHLTYLFISHDLSVIKYISDRVGVMYLGNMVEMARAEEIFANPIHPYTEALLSAIPTTDAEKGSEPIILEGDIPSPIDPPKGCKFHTRCRYAEDICRQVTPEYTEIKPEHFVACHVRTR
ncbi:hypothetical protein FACS1894202_09710 [Clostridia bacterium]|nr:hypothetical protein FACS1894202_09710 [Clostridia bacterium]